MEHFKISSRNLVESLLVLLLFVALLYAVYEVMNLFWGVLTFALIFSVSFIDGFEWLCLKFSGRRVWAAILYVLVLLLLIALPAILLISAMHTHVTDFSEWLTTWESNGLPVLPKWLTNLPLVGSELNTFWSHVQNDPKAFVQEHGPQAKSMLLHALHGGTGILGVAAQVIAGILLSAFFMANRYYFLHPLRSIARHVFGMNDGPKLLHITEQAIKGVSIGVMGTAFFTAVIGWIGLVIAGVPFSLGLSALIFFLVIIQVGPLPVWIPVTIWLFVEGHTGMAIFLLVYGIIVIVLENIIRPLLIAQSGKIPFLVLLVGVIGGLSAWGFTGMFKGAIVMAIGHTVLSSWLEKRNGEEENVNSEQVK